MTAPTETAAAGRAVPGGEQDSVSVHRPPGSAKALALSAECGKPLPTYLTPDEVGAMLQLSAKSIYRLWKADPTMPALKIGGSVRFHRERLERWLRDREQGRPQMRKPVLSLANGASEKESNGA